MTTPAENVSIDIPWSGTYQTRTSTTGPWGTPSKVSGRLGHTTKRRGESINVPVRDDGTRPPAPWDHRWGSMSLGVRTRVWSIPAFGWEQRGNSVPSFQFNPSGWVGDAGAGFVFGAGFPIAVQNEAIVRMLEKVRDGKANLGQTLGEMRQTAGFVSQACTKIIGALDAIARTVGKQRRDIVHFLYTNRWRKNTRQSFPPGWTRAQAEAVIASWLAFQFAIKPLLSDIETTGSALSWLLFEERRPARAVFRAGASHTWNVQMDSAKYQWGTLPVFTIRGRVQAFCHVSAAYEIPVNASRTFEQLGLGNLASVAWELTQFSWMVDYVVDVGGWLESLTAADGTTFVEGCISRKMVMDHPDAGGYKNGGTILRPSVPVSGFSSESIRGQYGRFQRSVLAESPVPTLPPLKRKIGLTQLANSLAALSQAIR